VKPRQLEEGVLDSYVQKFLIIELMKILRVTLSDLAALVFSVQISCGKSNTQTPVNTLLLACIGNNPEHV